MKKSLFSAFWLLLLAGFCVLAQAQTGHASPNIVMIMADDVAPNDISAIHRGLGAVRTPNIDRLAKEGLTVNDYYAQPSCTAGRAAFITGQYPIRTGLTSVGMPGSLFGINADDPTLAEMLKAKGYATGQFGKNHFGDRNEHLPTVHGFDEFFGILYALDSLANVEESDYPKNPAFPGRPRNAIYAWATDTDDASIDPRFGKLGKQRVEDKGAVGTQRMESFDDEVLAATEDWLTRTQKSGKPFFLWLAPTRMHAPIHIGPAWKGKSGHSDYTDGLLELDNNVGKLLNRLDALGLSRNTIVIFTSDNGVNLAHWPEGGSASFRGEKGTTWDGGFRVPMLVRWPGHIPTNEWSDQFMTSEDWVPTLMAAVGDATIKERLLSGTQLGDRAYKVHLDGYNQLPMLIQGGKSARREFFYYAETDLTAIRVDQWKAQWGAARRRWPDRIEVGESGDLSDEAKALSLQLGQFGLDSCSCTYRRSAFRHFLFDTSTALGKAPSTDSATAFKRANADFECPQ